MLPILLIGGAITAGCAIASRWEADNEEEEEELERTRARNARFLKMRRSQLEKNRRKKEIKLEILAREKELKLVKRAESIAKRNLELGKLELGQFSKDLTTANAASVRVPKEWVDTLFKELTDKTKDLKAVNRRCTRHREEVEKRIEELNGKRFFFKCCLCHRKFAVAYSELSEFTRSRKGMRKCCDDCFPAVSEKAAKRTKARTASRILGWR